MIKHNYPGKFIVLEGLDGSGQSTQTSLLNDFLIQNGKEVVLGKEPTKDSEAGRKIREVLGGKDKMDAKKLQELFAQDRKEHLQNKIIPALEAGKYVISDRYFFSSFAFGVSDDLDLEWLIQINNDFIMPDQTFILKASPKICMERITKRGTKKELFETEEKLGRVWQTYEKLPHRFESMFVIDGEKTPQEVFSEIRKILIKIL